MSKPPIYTIGYGARTIEEFIATLQAHDIAYVIDVRSKPYSRYKPEFSQAELERQLQSHSIRYVFMGDTLGGRPEDPQYLTADGKVDYEKLSGTVQYQAGIERLVKAYSQGLHVTLMCSEGRPEQCHRSHLIGLTLDDRQIPVAHIDERGDILDQDQVMLRGRNFQQSLPGFDGHRTTSRKKYEHDSRTETDRDS